MSLSNEGVNLRAKIKKRIGGVCEPAARAQKCAVPGAKLELPKS